MEFARDQRQSVPAIVSAPIPDALKTAADALRSIDPAWPAAISYQHQPQTEDGDGEFEEQDVAIPKVAVGPESVNGINALGPNFEFRNHSF